MAQQVVRIGVPVPTGTVLPATSQVTDLFYLTVGDIGLYVCTATNVWTLYDNALPPVSGTVISKEVTAIPNNVFTDVITVSVPNANTSAIIDVLLRGSLGAGGAVGPFEASSGRKLLILVTRVHNVATDASINVTSNAVDARVAGATTIAQTTQLSAINGLATADQTFTLQYRITRGAGASTNHVAAVEARTVGTSITIL